MKGSRFLRTEFRILIGFFSIDFRGKLIKPKLLPLMTRKKKFKVFFVLMREKSANRIFVTELFLPRVISALLC